MTKDQYAFNPLFLGPELAMNSEQNILENVPVSHAKAYLEGTYGAGIPTERADRFAADTFFEAATAYSTDESLREIITEGMDNVAQMARAYIPRWLQLTEPIVDAVRTLDKSATRILAPYETSAVPRQHDDNMAYMIGLFYIGTQMASLALDIAHPLEFTADVERQLEQKGQYAIAGQPDMPLPQTMLLVPSLVKAADIKKAERLKARTCVLNERAQHAAQKMIAITAAIEAGHELDYLLEQ